MVGFIQRFKNAFITTEAKTETAVDPGGQQFTGSMIKGIVPQHLYRPPFGFPREQDVMLNRKLGANAYVHSIVSTIQFEVASTEYEIVVKEGEEEDPEEKKPIQKFFYNPNGNAESFSYILRAVVKDILELDSGIILKVFDGAGNFKQIFARDGASFFKNPDIHGYLGDRDEIIPQYYFHYNQEKRTYDFIDRFNTSDDVKRVQDAAAYFQYGYTNASIPIPFGRREIIWFSANPRTESVYGRSPLDVLGDVLYTILYGATFNLDFYLNNNIPDGVIQLLGASKEQIDAFRTRWENNFTEKDIFANKRKKFFTFPITNAEAKFTPFTFSSKEMEVLEQQKWFWKIVMSCFGVTPSEMGFTEDSNRATEVVQSSVFRRKAVQPLLDLLEYHINLSLLPELDPTGKYEFRFVRDDLERDMRVAEINEKYLLMGVKSKRMVSMELGIDYAKVLSDNEEDTPEQEPQKDFYGIQDEERNTEVKTLGVSLKYKYTRREGSSGNYRYFYDEPKKERKKGMSKPQLMNLAEELATQVKTQDKKKIVTNYKAWKDKKDTYHTIGDGKGNYPLERRKTHRTIINDYNKDAQKAKAEGTPKVLFMAGLPGSGKTYSAQNYMKKIEGSQRLFKDNKGNIFLSMNADDIKEYLPEYDKGLGASMVHEESSDILNALMVKYREQGVNIIVDGTMKTKGSAYKNVELFKKEGYSTELFYVDVKPEVAMRRAQQRYLTKGRYVPYGFIAEADSKIRNSVESLKNEFDNFIHMDNNGRIPRRVE